MFVLAKVTEREEARKIRATEGASVKAIARRLGVSVSSVSLWVRDIDLSEAQRAALRRRIPATGVNNRRSETARELRRGWQDVGRREAAAGDAMHRAGCMLFWAEGSKDRASVKIANSDPDLLRMFIRFLESSYGISRERLAFCCQVHLGNGLNLSEIEAWWLAQLELPASCLRKSSVITRQPTSKRRINKLVHGTGYLALHSTEIVQRIYGAIQEYGGFERPEWLG